MVLADLNFAKSVVVNALLGQTQACKHARRRLARRPSADSESSLLKLEGSFHSQHAIVAELAERHCCQEMTSHTSDARCASGMLGTPIFCG